MNQCPDFMSESLLHLFRILELDQTLKESLPVNAGFSVFEKTDYER